MEAVTQKHTEHQDDVWEGQDDVIEALFIQELQPVPMRALTVFV